jgi:hypothetical protein
MISPSEFAARIRHCHADAFRLMKPDWIDAPEHERVRWLTVAEHYRNAIDASMFRVMGRSGRLLYESWNSHMHAGCAVPWSQLSLAKRERWMDAAQDAATWGMEKAA